MMHPSTKKLLDRLAEMTRQRRIAWQETSSGTGVAYVAEGYTVHLVKEPQALQLSDANGTILEDVSSDDMAATQSETGQGYTAIFDEMLREASRQARGTERAIDTVLAGLDLDGDGIPDIPAPVQTSQQPSEPTSDAGEYEDVADETGAVDAWGAVQSDEAAGAAGADTANQWTSPATPTYQAAADPQTAIQAEPEPAPASTFSSETQPSTWDTSPFGSSSQASPDHSPETPGVEADASDDSATNVSEAVANMANEVNGGGQTPSAAAPASGGGILGGGSFGSFGTSGFGGSYSAPTPPQEPAPTPVDEPVTQASAAPEPEPAPTPSSWATEPTVPSWQTVASAPALQEPVLQEPVETTAATWPTTPAPEEPSPHAPQAQEAAAFSSPPSAFSAQTEPRSEEQSAWTASSEVSPSPDGGHGSDAPDAYEDAPSGYTTHNDSASYAPEERSEPTESREWSQGPAQADYPSTVFQGDTASDVTPDWATPSAPGSTHSIPVAAEPVATETYAAPASFGQATEEATGAFASTAGSVAAEATTAVDETAGAAEAATRSAWETDQETTQVAASGVDEAARAASANVTGAAASLMGAAGQAGQSVADTAGEAATAASGAARSILGGAASQAVGASNSLAAGAGAATGTVGQAIEGVANKLSPQNTLQREPASDGEGEGQNRQKPLTRFNPWS